MGTKLLMRNFYEYEEDKLTYGCHTSFWLTPLRHLVIEGVAVYVVAAFDRDNLNKTGKISKLATCIIWEIQKALAWLPVQDFALLLLLMIGNLEVEQWNDLQWSDLRLQLCKDSQLLKKLLGRQIYEDTNIVNLPLVCTESKLIILLNVLSVCTEHINFVIR